MKTLIISHMYPSSFDKTEGIFVHEQVKALIKRGCDIRVVSPVPRTTFPVKYLSKKWLGYSNIPYSDIYEGVQIYYPRYTVYPKASFFHSSGERMFKGINDLVSNIHGEFPFDLIHAHVAVPDGAAAIRIKNKLKKPLVVTVHGQDLQVTIFRNPKCKKILRETFNQVDKIIVVSNKLKKIAEKEFGENNRICVINNGIVTNGYDFKKSNLKSAKHDSKTILSVSNLIATKGIDQNMYAISRLKNKYPDIKYKIIGDGVERKKLELLARNLRINDKVKFLGKLSHSKVMQHISEADIFSLPSWREGFGVVYIEAMAFGLPVIACKGEGIEDVITDSETGLLVESKNVDGLVDKLDYLLNNPIGAKQIGERAQNLVLSDYAWDNNAEKTIDIYKEVLENRDE